MMAATACDPTASEGSLPGQCDDGADNDVDGLFDCADSDCAGAPVCAAGGDSGTCMCDLDAGSCDDPSCACDPDCAGGGDGGACACDTTSMCEMGCGCDPACAGGSDAGACACDLSPACDPGCPCDFDCPPGGCGCAGNLQGVEYDLACGTSTACSLPDSAICPDDPGAFQVVCSASGDVSSVDCRVSSVPACGACTSSDECECESVGGGTRFAAACYGGRCRVNCGPSLGDYVEQTPDDGPSHGRGYCAGDGC